jgi:hypothetical protein
MEDNIKIILQELGSENEECVHLAQGTGQSLSFCELGFGFSVPIKRVADLVAQLSRYEHFKKFSAKVS